MKSIDKIRNGGIKYKTLTELIREGKDEKFVYPCGRNREQIEDAHICPCGVNPLKPRCFMFLFCEQYYVTYSDVPPDRVPPFFKWLPAIYGWKQGQKGNQEITDVPEHLKP